MSVNSAMTAIADKIRTLLGTSDTMGLDNMSTNLQTAVTTVDTQTDLITQIEAALEGKTALPTLSNAGTASDLASGKQLIDQNGNIITGTHQCPAGVTVQRKAGTFKTNSSGVATVNCGWQPDVVYVKGIQDTGDDGTVSNSAAWFAAEENRTNPLTVMWTTGGLHEMLWSKSSTGFTVEMMKMDYDFQDSLLTNTTFNYVAIKYT